ncbi:TetR/AcrR family transcriptional regulator [Chryseolinea soli]|uniref:TetR/AcrR family transcriptional regulator n=1 Tax=Chryseolinea soli TaxID=2321403 RepID=A0A385SNT5_9BACT|nr:TetR/AcrR family transcriptional regulator [Chryseolinea soli]AYB32644.1 TetR/AcrR family transcriptional regulator [Chryseolinea soli]
MSVVVLSKDELIRVEVLKASRTLFQRFGLFKTTMEDIAKAVGKGKSTLYYYYESKDEIFDAVIREDMQEVFSQVKAAVEKACTAEEKLRMFTISKIRAINQKANLYGIVFGEISENPQLIKGLKKNFEAQELELLRDILVFGIYNNEFKRITDQDLDDLSHIMLSATRGIEMGLLEDCRIKKMGDRLEVILDLICHGIKSGAGSQELKSGARIQEPGARS